MVSSEECQKFKSFVYCGPPGGTRRWSCPGREGTTSKEQPPGLRFSRNWVGFRKDAGQPRIDPGELAQSGA